MEPERIFQMSQKELRKVHIIKGVIEKQYTQKEAGKILALSDRQIRRLQKKVEKNGEKGLMHGLRGKQSNRAYDEAFKKDVIELYDEKYPDFGPTFASEKLVKLDHIQISDETLRLWLRAECQRVYAWQRKGRQHRQWRERRRWFGCMIQIDGSQHDWLEGRGPKLVLMGYIDDATNEVFGRFYLYEGTMPVFDSMKRYIQKYGIPHSVYLDRHSTYKSPGKPSIEDQLLDRKVLTQVGRAFKELGIEVIHANSPQAKGRVERLFRTFQDRLIKEMRLANIMSLAQANNFLESYVPKYNKQFGVQALEKGDMHRKIPKGMRLDAMLCKKEERALRNDFTVWYENKLYQVLDKTRALKVTVEERIDGRLYITYQGKKLRYKEIPRQFIAQPRQKKEVMQKPIEQKPAKPYKPPKNHPWRLCAAAGFKQAEARRNRLLMREEQYTASLEAV
jgi:hypothetical protein